jgi:hypothetical protein
MPFIPLQFLLRPSTKPEQEIFLTNFYAQFNNGSAVHKLIQSVEPVYYQGLIAGTEFLTYVVTKLYICYSIEFDSANVTNAQPFITFFDETNTNSYFLNNSAPYWDASGTAVKHDDNVVISKNLYFSRITTTLYTSMVFIGYRVTLN